MTLIDRNDIFVLAQDPSAEVKAELCRKVVNTLDHLTLGESERELARDVLALLAKDVEMRVRASVARQIAASPHLTEDLARRLASDVEDEVALPVIQNAASLAEELLLELVQAPSTIRRVAIAGRPDVTEDVAGAIIDCANLAAIVTLVRNEKARIAEKQLAKVTDVWGRLPEIQTALVERPELPTTIVEQLVSIVSQNLRTALIEKYDLEPEIVAHLVARGREAASLLILKRLRTPQHDPLLFALQLQKRNRLSTPFVFLTLLSGDIDLFCNCLSVKARVSLENVRKLVFDQGTLALPRLLGHIDIRPNLQPAFQAAIAELIESGYDGSESERGKFQIRAIRRVQETCSERRDEDLHALLAAVMNAGTVDGGGLLALANPPQEFLEA